MTDALFDLNGLADALTAGKTELVIRVIGVPQAQGSKTGFATFRTGADGQRVYTGKVAMTEGKTPAARDRHKTWRAMVADAAAEAMAGAEPLVGAVLIRATFTMPRPKAHYRTGKYAGVIKSGVPHWHTTKPDRGKLERSVEDSLKDGGVYRDDSQAAASMALKVYTWPTGLRGIPVAADVMPIPGVVIRVWQL